MILAAIISLVALLVVSGGAFWVIRQQQQLHREALEFMERVTDSGEARRAASTQQQITTLQAAVAQSVEAVTSAITQSLTAPPSAAPDTLMPSVEMPAYEQDDDPIGDDWDPTDATIPDPASWRPEVLLGRPGDRNPFGIEGLTIDPSQARGVA